MDPVSNFVKIILPSIILGFDRNQRTFCYIYVVQNLFYQNISDFILSYYTRTKYYIQGQSILTKFEPGSKMSTSDLFHFNTQLYSE